MNLDHNPTPAELKQLLSSIDDDSDAHIIYVTKNGDVYIAPVFDETPAGFESKNKKDIQFRLETFGQSNGYAGSIAADDDEYVGELLDELQQHWAQKTEGYADDGMLDR